MELTAAFPDDGNVICSTFFTSTDATERTWNDLDRLISGDDVTFWTVIAHHKSLVNVLGTMITTVDNARNGVITNKRTKSETLPHFGANDERNLTSFFMRVATSSEVCYNRHVNACSLAIRLDELFSWKLLSPLCLLLLRQRCGAAASLTITALCILNPQLLNKGAAFVSSWCDTVDKLASRVIMELRRGRFQRLPGDVMMLFEQLFRHVRHLWALMQCAPFLCNYCPLPRTLRALRLIIDFISPVLQHFALVSDALHPRRALLSRATSVIINATINCAVVLMLFRSFIPVNYTDSNNNNNNIGSCNTGEDTPPQVYCLPERVQQTYDSLTSFMMMYCPGYPHLLLSNRQTNEVQKLLEQLAPTDDAHINYNYNNSNTNVRKYGNNTYNNKGNDDVSDDDSHYLGKVLLLLLNELTDGKDYADVLEHSRPRFLILLLKELVHQGMHIDNLVFNKLITLEEALKLGASPEFLSKFTSYNESGINTTVNTNNINETKSHNVPHDNTFTLNAPCAEESTILVTTATITDSSNNNNNNNCNNLVPNKEDKSDHLFCNTSVNNNVKFDPDLLGKHLISEQKKKAEKETTTTTKATSTLLEPEVSMVKDVFPHFTVSGIRAALAFYNNDVEQFILDASMENLPPHIAPTLISNDDAIAAALAEPIAQSALDDAIHCSSNNNINNNNALITNSRGTNSAGNVSDKKIELDLFTLATEQCDSVMHDSDYDSALLAQDLFEYLSGLTHSEHHRAQLTHAIKGNEQMHHVDEADNDSNNLDFDSAFNEEDELNASDEDVVDKQEFYTRWGTDAAEGKFDDALTMNTHAGGFEIDDEMRERIRVLNELMYEDEFDDTALEEVHLAGASDNDSDIEDEQIKSVRPVLNIHSNEMYKNDYSKAENTNNTNNNNNNNNNNNSSVPFHPVQRDAYHDKRFHEQRARARAQRTKEMRSNRAKATFTQNSNGDGMTSSTSGVAGVSAVPAYAHKQKTTRRSHHNNNNNNNIGFGVSGNEGGKGKGGGRGKNAIAQALKKGKATSY